MLQFDILRDDAALSGGPEHLLKVQGLPLVGDVEDFVGLKIPHPLYHGGKVGGGVDGRAVGLHQNAGGNLLFVRLLGNGNDPGALALHRKALGLEVGNHVGDEGVGVAFAQPGLKMHVQRIVNPGHVRHGQLHDVLPDGPIAPAAVLQLICGGVSLFRKDLIDFFLGRGGGIDFLQLRNGEGGFCRVFPGVGFVEIAQIRLTLLQFRDDQAHLQAPVTQMDVADGVVAEELVQPFQALADDGGAQVADVQGLGNVGAAVVHHDGFPRALLGNAKVLSGAHFFQIRLQKVVGQLEVDEARHDGLHQRIVLSVQLLYHRLGNFDGGTLILFGGGQGAVALVLAQVGPVGNRHPAKGSVIPGIGKGLLHFFRNNI